MRALSTLLAIAPVLAAARNCPLQFDGRVGKHAKLELLDTDESPFNAEYVKGAGEFWTCFFIAGRVLRFVAAPAWQAEVERLVWIRLLMINGED